MLDEQLQNEFVATRIAPALGIAQEEHAIESSDLDLQTLRKPPE
jgi:hypothetical protein